MAAAPGNVHVTLDCEKGPVLRCALDVLDLVVELGGHLPLEVRGELLDRAHGLAEMAKASLRQQANRHTDSGAR